MFVYVFVLYVYGCVRVMYGCFMNRIGWLGMPVDQSTQTATDM